MAKETNQNAAERRSWKDRLRERQPDINVDDEMAVGDYLGDSFQRYDDMAARQKQFDDMLSTDPNSAGILTGLATGLDENGEPFSLAGYMVEKYGDIVRDASSEEEAVQKAKEREAESIQKAAEEAKKKEDRQKALDDNFPKTDAALTEAMQRANVDAATVNEMLKWLYGESKDNPDGLIHKIASFQLDADDWERILYAFNRDNALNGAREEGRLEGARQRPGAQHRRMRDNSATDLGGGGGAISSEQQGDPTLDHYSKMGRRF